MDERLALSKEDLKINGYIQRRGDLRQLPRHVDDKRFAFDHAGTGDQEERRGVAGLESGELHARATRGSLSPWQERAAVTKLANSGCPSRGLDVNSGWN